MCIDAAQELLRTRRVSGHATHILHAHLFPQIGCGFRWHVSSEAPEEFVCLHMFQNQMHYFDILPGAKLQDDVMFFHAPPPAANGRHIWWMC